MKKINIFLCLLLISLFILSFDININASNKIVINSTDWMASLPDDLKITDLNIPGVHDAGTAHTTATVSAQYTICQHYYIGNNKTDVYKLFSGWSTKVEPGLLEQGVRYFDIRFDLHDFDPEDEEDLADAEEEIKKNGNIKFAADHLELCHGIFTCRYLESEVMGWNDWEDVTGTKLLTWVNNFLSQHRDEVIIFDVSAEDDDNKSYIYDLCRQLFGGLALEQEKGFPSVYYGDHVPTLKEARGKIFILADFSYDLSLYDESENYLGNWAFKANYNIGDEKNKTYDLVTSSKNLKYQVYKNNKYKEVDEDEKWIWVKNGLNDAEDIYLKAKSEGYDPFLLLYTSANDIKNIGIFRSPQGYAEDINPKVYDYIMNNNYNKKGQYYGILAMDFMNDPRYGSDMATVIWSSNYYRNYDFIDFNFDGVNYQYIDNSYEAAAIIGEGNGLIIIGGCIIIVGGLIASFIIIKKQKNKKNFKKEEKAQE